MLIESEIHAFKNRLRTMMQRVKEKLGVLREETLKPSGGEADGDLSDVPFHKADQASREAEESLNLDVIGNEEHLQAEMDAALTRIEQGFFGRCEECQQPIAKDRLEAAPYSRWCIRCAEKREAQ